MATPDLNKRYQLTLMPYATLGGIEELTFGPVVLWNACELNKRVSDPALRKRVGELLNMYREPSRRWGAGEPVRGVGILSIGSSDFRELSDREYDAAQEFRAVLFLSCLARNAKARGSNAGFALYTADNFDIIRQFFVLDSEYFAETAGVIIQMTNMGLRISESRFVRPPHINHPPSFQYDETLFRELGVLRKRNRTLYRRIIRAASVFMESFYNSATVSIPARILLQSSAFEILLELPAREERFAFKNEIERLLSRKGERRYRYKFETQTTRRVDTRTLKGIWADRFYTLRNHLVHGDVVRRNEYDFRSSQHHLLITPLMFVLTIKRLIDAWRIDQGKARIFVERITWGVTQRKDKFQPEHRGFLIEHDFFAKLSAADEKALRSRILARRKKSDDHVQVDD